MGTCRSRQHQAPRVTAISTALALLVTIALTSTAEASTPTVSGTSAVWSSGKIRVAWTKTSSVKSVKIDVFRNATFAFRSTDATQTMPTTYVTSYGRAGSKTVAIWPGTGANSGNSSYVRVTGINGSAKSSPKMFRVRAPKPAAKSGNAFTVKTATFNTMCAVQCDAKTTVDGVVKPIPESSWENRRTPFVDAIVNNPRLAYKNSAGVDVQDKPDVIGTQEVSDYYPRAKSQLFDLRDELAKSGYGMSNAIDNTAQNFNCQSAIKYGTVDQPAESKLTRERVFYRSDWYQPVADNGLEVSGEFTIGCTAKLQQRATNYRTGVDKSANNTNIQRDAGYVLLKRVQDPGAGQVFLVFSAHPTSNINSPTTAAALKEHNTDRAEARQQAGREILAKAEELNLRYKDLYNAGKSIPVIVTGDLNSETKNSRDGRFKGAQQALVDGGFVDARAYADAINGRFSTFNYYAASFKASAYNDGDRIDYILGRNIFGVSKFRNMLPGYAYSAALATAVGKSSLSALFAAYVPSDHNMQYAEVRIGY